MSYVPPSPANVDDRDLLGRRAARPGGAARAGRSRSRCDGGGVLERDVDPGHVPGRRRVARGRDLEAAGRVHDDTASRSRRGRCGRRAGCRSPGRASGRPAAAARHARCGRASSGGPWLLLSVRRAPARLPAKTRGSRRDGGRARRGRRRGRSSRRRCRRGRRRPRHGAARTRRASRRGRGPRLSRRPRARRASSSAGNGRKEVIFRRPTASPSSRSSSTTSLTVPAVEPSATIARSAPSSR